jgi:small-conductance mechanosensitive channel
MFFLSLWASFWGWLADISAQTLYIGGVSINVPAISGAVVVLIVAIGIDFILLGYIRLRMHQHRFRNDSKAHNTFLIRQLGRYCIYGVAVFLCIQRLGVPTHHIFATFSMFSLGIGLGIQKIFQDLVSGFTILIASSEVKVGDVIAVGEVKGRVVSIGLRSTTVETRDRDELVIPNSFFTGSYFENFTRNKKPTRLALPIGVAYGSDLEKVRKLLEEVAYAHPVVIAPSKFKCEDWRAKVQSNQINAHLGDEHHTEEPTALMVAHGDSALQFELVFYTREVFNAKELCAELRLALDKAFRLHNIQIPFPQRDVWVRSNHFFD